MLGLKRSFMGQFEAAFFHKTHQTNLLRRGKVESVDLLASAIKESIAALPTTFSKERELFLILPQEAVHFFRVELPKDIAQSAVAAFVKDKARASISPDLEYCSYDYYVVENMQERTAMFFAVEVTTMTQYIEAAQLLNLEVVGVMPERVAYFALFDKTLRKDKKEHIMYVTHEENEIVTHLYDSYGPIQQDKWAKAIDNVSVSKLLRQRANKYEDAGMKINRLILAGADSEHVRQDTFTKDVGVWTNPLKRIIPTFYQDYLKMLIFPSKESFPYLIYDACFGAFIFTSQQKQFSLIKNKGKRARIAKVTTPSVRLPFGWKEITLLFGAFVLSFAGFIALSRVDLAQWFQPPVPVVMEEPTPTPEPVAIATATPEPTPTPALSREEVNIKVLNGAGIAGKADEVRSILQELEYVDIVTGNANRFDYETTEIQIKEEDRQRLRALIEEDIADYVDDPSFTTIDEGEVADIIIIIGEDFR